MRLFGSAYYKGTRYSGWQKQPGALTIQDTIESCLSRFFGNTPISIYGAGRTDAGVHAFSQKFHFDVDVTEIDLDRLIYSLNKMLPEDIKIDDIEEVEPSFHSRYSAKAKVYTYCILEESKDPFLYETSWLHPDKIDTDKLQECLTHFIGVHNFKNFTSKEEDEDNFVREIYGIDVSRQSDLIYITFKGQGFMRYMIRLIVGTAVHICDKDLDPFIIEELLDENAPREVVSYKAPACGLTLVDVEY
ncbi:MAG: tRNA pseudouridine(38-40) synthase TruA [Bacilli bacterium]|nr:tRNA pseudouridine(38-40) synthase TruA [Bacilli bacterium]